MGWIIVNLLFIYGVIGDIYNMNMLLLILGCGLYGCNLILLNVIVVNLINVKRVVCCIVNM